jgi:CheB methylesterase
MPGHDIIVIGTSAGGVEALTTVVRPLAEDLPAAVFIVLHIPAEGPSLLANILNHNGSLHAIESEDGMAIEHGHIYVARPDHHLMLDRDKIRVVRGPKENRHRPAIDPLFRSAAVAYGPRVDGERAGRPSVFSCPECGGVLWELEDGDLLRFRCRVGHAFSLETMQAEQSRAVEEALWTALKTLEESMSLSERMADHAHSQGREWLAHRFEEKQHEAEQHAHQIRNLLMNGEKVVPPDPVQ